MEVAISVVVGLIFAVSIYLMMSEHTIRILLGVVLITNAVNLLIFTSGRIGREAPPIIPAEYYLPPEAIANPLPQALVLTAIVIAFSLFAFLMVLAYRAFQNIGTDDTRHMRLAEPEDKTEPPLGY